MTSKSGTAKLPLSRAVSNPQLLNWQPKVLYIKKNMAKYLNSSANLCTCSVIQTRWKTWPVFFETGVSPTKVIPLRRGEASVLWPETSPWEEVCTGTDVALHMVCPEGQQVKTDPCQKRAIRSLYNTTFVLFPEDPRRQATKKRNIGHWNGGAWRWPEGQPD